MTINAILTITRFTVQEAIRRRLVLVAGVLSLIYLALFWYGFSSLVAIAPPPGGSAASLTSFIVATNALSLLGLYVVNFLASFLALFLAVGSVSSEIESGAIQAVLARPVRRSAFIAGRWFGYFLLLTAYSVIMVGSVVLIANRIVGFEPGDPVRAIALVTLEAAFLMTVSLLGSAILPTLANGVVGFALFGLAWLAGIIEFIGNTVSNPSMVNAGVAISLIVPTDALWRGASYYLQSPLALAVLSGPTRSIPWASTSPPTQTLIVWSLAYIGVLVAGAVIAFGRRDV